MIAETRESEPKAQFKGEYVNTVACNAGGGYAEKVWEFGSAARKKSVDKKAMLK